MATLSLKPKTANIEADTPTAALDAYNAETQLANPSGIPEFFQGDSSATQVRPPSLRIIGKTGKLCDQFPKNIGELVYDGEVILGTSVKAVVVSMKFGFEETLSYGGDELPERWDSVADAKASGKDYHPTAIVSLLLEMPQGIELGEQIDGKFYAPAVFYIKRFDVSTWNSILKKDAMLRYKGDPRKGLYTISAKLIKGRANSWYGPALAAAGNTPDKVYDFVVTQLSQPLA